MTFEKTHSKNSHKRKNDKIENNQFAAKPYGKSIDGNNEYLKVIFFQKVENIFFKLRVKLTQTKSAWKRFIYVSHIIAKHVTKKQILKIF